MKSPLDIVRGETECDLLGGEYGFGTPSESDLHSIKGLVLPRLGFGLPIANREKLADE